MQQGDVVQKLIIDRPKLQTIYQRYGSVTLTVFFWMVWCYIWTPLITLVCWLFGIEFIYTEIFTYLSFKLFIADVGLYLITIGILCAVLFFWAIYNLLRFKNASNYKECQAVSLEEISHYANIKKESLAKYQKTKMLTVKFDEHNTLVDIQELGTTV